MTEKPVMAPGEFFRPDTVYTTRENAYMAPEQVLEFDARHLTMTPDGHRIVFGFARWENDPWSPTGFGNEDWDGRSWYLKGEEGHQ